MARKGDEVKEKHFTTRKVDGKEICKCNYCKHEFKFSNARQLRTHLARGKTCNTPANVRDYYIRRSLEDQQKPSNALALTRPVNAPQYTAGDVGKATMVDVTDKAESTRTAAAQAIVQLSEATFKRVSDNTMRKGDVLTVAQLAGIMGAKRTSELIPLCHPLFLSKVSVDLHLLPLENSIRIQSEVRTKGSTGVEMEALTAVSVASLCVYDMCKSIGHEITITDTKLVSKTGGKSDFST